MKKSKLQTLNRKELIISLVIEIVAIPVLFLHAVDTGRLWVYALVFILVFAVFQTCSLLIQTVGKSHK